MDLGDQREIAGYAAALQLGVHTLLVTSARLDGIPFLSTSSGDGDGSLGDLSGGTHSSAL
jgi:hypothetical protein